MRNIRPVSGLPVLAVVAVLMLVGCGSNSPAARQAEPYEGQWSYVGMGVSILNLRSDGAFSLIGFCGAIGSEVCAAHKGTYTFTPDTVGDNTHGTLIRRFTHEYNFTTDTWDAITMSDVSDTCVIDNTASPRTMALGISANINEYYGAETAIPTTL